MDRIFALDSIVSFTGIITFKNADIVRAALSAAPRGKFMLETDSPFLAPVPYRGKKCEPAYVADTARVAAALANCSLEELSAATCATAHEFFPKLK
jgi:TatD DNase family protein